MGAEPLVYLPTLAILAVMLFLDVVAARSGRRGEHMSSAFAYFISALVGDAYLLALCIHCMLVGYISEEVALSIFVTAISTAASAGGCVAETVAHMRNE